MFVQNEPAGLEFSYFLIKITKITTNFFSVHIFNFIIMSDFTQ